MITVPGSAESVLANTVVLDGDGTLVLHGSGQSLADYVRDYRPALTEALLSRGSLLFRGFGSLTVPTFRSAVGRFVDEFLEAQGEHTRVSGEQHVFHPVRYSPERKLLWHNENSFNLHWPHVIAFGCVQPAPRGGESLLVDSRAVLEALDPSVVAEFKAKGVQYVRRMGLGIDRHWKDIFGTGSMAQVEALCAQQGCSFRWLGKDVLETVCVRSATVVHPVTGLESWFNQLPHWHIHCLAPDVRRDLLAVLGEERMPRDCRFGDGSAIEDAIVDHVLQAYSRLEHCIACQTGDVLIVDNVAVAHGRQEYQGRREMLVAMGKRRIAI